MESMMTLESQEKIATILQECTDNLRRILAELHAQSSENAAKVASPQQMSDLISGLMQAGRRLRVLPSNQDPNLERKVYEYRIEVERLRVFLPAIQASLLSERGRLENERVRQDGAAAWAQATRQIAK